MWRVAGLVLGVVVLTVVIPRMVTSVEGLANPVSPSKGANGSPTPTDNVLALAIDMQARLGRLEKDTQANTAAIAQIQTFITTTKAQLAAATAGTS